MLIRHSYGNLPIRVFSSYQYIPSPSRLVSSHLVSSHLISPQISILSISLLRPTSSTDSNLTRLNLRRRRSQRPLCRIRNRRRAHLSRRRLWSRRLWRVGKRRRLGHVCTQPRTHGFGHTTNGGLWSRLGGYGYFLCGAACGGWLLRKRGRVSRWETFGLC